MQSIQFCDQFQVGQHVFFEDVGGEFYGTVVKEDTGADVVYVDVRHEIIGVARDALYAIHNTTGV